MRRRIDGPAPAGLFFRRRLRSHTRMNPDLANVIRQALEDALAVGKDHMGQTVLAVQAVQRAWPDLTASDAAPVSSESRSSCCLKRRPQTMLG